ncbi:Barstar, RNAse (barnase) inhibitor [Halolactibacillus halophilus]|nr:Barstar, RNAse (barnase) inhibitor [Halolactibacillus halophilus]
MLILDGKQLLSIEDVHCVVKETFDVPYYGKNLDALWDVLTTQKELRVIIKHDALLQKHLEQDYTSLICLFEDLKSQPLLYCSVDIKS